MTTMRGNACGKVILCGEHAVVHGVPALAVGIDRGASAEATPVAGPSTLRIRDWNVNVSTDDAEGPAVGAAFRALVEISRVSGGRAVVAQADLPPGGGLGCSAALGVAVARALDPSAPSDVIAERANAWERVFHGNPSGVDAAVAAEGGCVYFQRRDEGRLLERVRAPRVMPLCIGHTGQASSTKTMVEVVARQLERKTETTKKTFAAIETLVKNARLAFQAGDFRAVGQLLDLNQMLLASLFVSTPEIEQLCGSARAAGAYGAKLTGAGGGGCVVALVEDARVADAVLAAWKADGFEGFSTVVNAGASPHATPSSPPVGAVLAPEPAP